MGEDEFVPTTGKCDHWLGIGLTVLDSLDTLLLMGLTEEYEKSREWAERSLHFNNTVSGSSVFEIVIRALGGLNSAYEMTGDALWKEKSVELADLLLRGFNLTKTGCPPPQLHIEEDEDDDQVIEISNPAEAGTMQLEFRTVSRITGDGKYAKAVDRCMESLIEATESEEDGLVTDTFNLNDGTFSGSILSIAGKIDSFYEMLVKTWVAFGKKDERYRIGYERAVKGIFKHLTKEIGGYMIVGTMDRGRPKTFSWRMDHLACFFPGNLAYAALHGLGGGVNGSGEEDYMTVARALTKGCVEMTKGSHHGLAAESSSFERWGVKAVSGRDVNYLRPEIVEALFYMDRIDKSGGTKYKEWGRDIWLSIRKFCQVRGKQDGILSTTRNLLKPRGRLKHSGKLESFAIAETFKYLFLLFDGRASEAGRVGRLSLDEWVFNTEAHPVRIMKG